MIYKESHGWHILDMTESETNEHFAPHNPLDYEIPSYLYNARHRFILEDTYKWLLDNVGMPNVDWRHEGTTLSRRIMFEDKEKAMLFKLTFHGT